MDGFFVLLSIINIGNSNLISSFFNFFSIFCPILKVRLLLGYKHLKLYIMETRINLFEQGQKAISTLFGISGYLKKATIEKSLMELVDFRISQINNCAYCLDMHSKEAIANGETTQRLLGLSAWKETPYFTQRERVALAFAEAVNACDVPDEIYEIAKAQFTEQELIDLALAVAAINAWNRLNITFANTPGTYRVGQFG